MEGRGTVDSVLCLVTVVRHAKVSISNSNGDNLFSTKPAHSRGPTRSRPRCGISLLQAAEQDSEVAHKVYIISRISIVMLFCGVIRLAERAARRAFMLRRQRLQCELQQAPSRFVLEHSCARTGALGLPAGPNQARSVAPTSRNMQ